MLKSFYVNYNFNFKNQQIITKVKWCGEIIVYQEIFYCGL
jgi:hypothetical protein